MSTKSILPQSFSQLEPFVADWALANERERFLKLHASSLEEVRAFYDAMLPEMDSILAYLDAYALDNMPPEVETLFHLATTFAETAHPVDLGWNAVDFPSAHPWQRFEFRTVSLER